MKSSKEAFFFIFLKRLRQAAAAGRGGDAERAFFSGRKKQSRPRRPRRPRRRRRRPRPRPRPRPLRPVFVEIGGESKERESWDHVFLSAVDLSRLFSLHLEEKKTLSYLVGEEGAAEARRVHVGGRRRDGGREHEREHEEEGDDLLFREVWGGVGAGGGGG